MSHREGAVSRQQIQPGVSPRSNGLQRRAIFPQTKFKTSQGPDRYLIYYTYVEEKWDVE